MSIAARLNGRVTRLAAGRHLPQRTVRIRLTLLYSSLFLLSGAALMAITYALLVNAGFIFSLQNDGTTQPPPGQPSLARSGWPSGLPGPGSKTHPSAQTLAHWRTVAQCMRQHGISRFPDPTTTVPSTFGGVGVVSDRDGAVLLIPHTINTQSPAFTQTAKACGFIDTSAVASRRRTQLRQELLIQSGIALAGMSLLSLFLGWLVAGRVLQPLEESYEAQRQFVANASHELRAPLTRLRTLSEVALASSDANFSSLRAAHERVLASEQHLEQLIDGLLTLTRGQAGLERREPVDLEILASQALRAREPDLASLDLDLRTTLATAPAAGDPRLIERLIANLIDNAIRHNTPHGHVEIATGTRDRHAFVSITNTGPAVPPGEIQRLFRPFQRLGSARTRHKNGHGLGLSIVHAIATAHDAILNAHARPQGGLTIEVSFPPASAARSRGNHRGSPDDTRPPRASRSQTPTVRRD